MRTLGGEGPLSQKSEIFASSPKGRAKGGPAAYALSGRTAAFFHAPKNQRTLAEAMKKPTKSANRAAGMV